MLAEIQVNDEKLADILERIDRAREELYACYRALEQVQKVVIENGQV